MIIIMGTAGKATTTTGTAMMIAIIIGIAGKTTTTAMTAKVRIIIWDCR